MHYILLIRHTMYFLVGPFKSRQAAADWGNAPANNPEHDGRWEIICLNDPTEPPRICLPDGGTM